MKLKATKKEMRNGYHRIISIPYCDAQYLLYYESPIAYSCGVYGWSCDYYDINGVLISTGYSPIDSKNTNISRNTIREFDLKAQKASNIEEKKKLLDKFIKLTGRND